MWYHDKVLIIECLHLDSVLYYIVFFAAGYCVYPYIKKLLLLDAKWKKHLYLLLLVFTTIYAIFLFEDKSLLSVLSITKVGNLLVSLIQPFILILFVVLVSRLLVGIHLFERMGRETLYLCGNEWIIKSIFPSLISVLGLEVTLSNPIVTYI